MVNLLSGTLVTKDPETRARKVRAHLRRHGQSLRAPAQPSRYAWPRTQLEKKVAGADEETAFFV